MSNSELLDNLLNGDMQKAVHWLAAASKNLREYAELMPAASGGPSNKPAETESDSESGEPSPSSDDS